MGTNDIIQIGKSKNVNSVNVDMYKQIYLKNNVSNLDEFDITKVINSSDIFESERESSIKYNIYGKIEYLSLLNGIISDYEKLDDLFNPHTTLTSKSIYNSFDFYLLIPADNRDYTQISDLGSLFDHKKKRKYIRYFKVIGTPKDIKIVNAGFNKNLFNEQTYVFLLNKTIDIKDKLDGLKFPITNLYLYAKYKPAKNKTTKQLERVWETTWREDGTQTQSLISKTSHNLNDIIMGDVIEYNIAEYAQTILKNQKHIIETSLKPTQTYSDYNLHWEYNPFIQLSLRNFSRGLNIVDVADSRYEIVNTIPDYIEIGDDNVAVWRDLEREGYVDVINNRENNHPFLNGCRYAYFNTHLTISPRLSHATTKNVFEQIYFDKKSVFSGYKPKTELEDFNKPCK